jgi:hypothetical protein
LYFSGGLFNKHHRGKREIILKSNKEIIFSACVGLQVLAIDGCHPPLMQLKGCLYNYKAVIGNNFINK